MPLTALIVDDTVVYRRILAGILSEFNDVTVVDTAANGSIAIKKLAVQPVDLVLLDVQMPVMDGIETLKYIKEHYPDINVVMVSGCSGEATKITLQALKMGALEFIRKPEGKTQEESKQQISSELKSIISILKIRAILHDRKEPKTEIAMPVAHLPGRVVPTLHRGTYGIVCIGTSTGGPNALTKLVSGLDKNFPLPILTVQHMPPNFTAALAEDLDRKSSLRVIEASDDMEILPGTMIIAKGGRHMIVRMKNNQLMIGLNDEPPENSCKPSVDVLFRSVADYYGDKGVLAAVMTGMGSDGLAGMHSLKHKECHCITQSASSCIVYGMPRAIDEAGLSDESVDLDNIAGRMNLLVKNSHY
jgi:two-component system chemotaxis response regulator CheB